MGGEKVKLNYDGPIRIATGISRTAAVWKNKELQWSEFLALLAETTRTRETMAEFRKLSKNRQDAVKDIGGFVGGWLRQGRRRTEYLQSRSLITLDADYATMDLLESCTLLYGCAAAVYSTHKHTMEAPRMRLIVPLSRGVSGDEYQAAARMLAADLGMELFDDTTYQPTRLMYWPSTSIDGNFHFDYADEPWLDPDVLLARYPDWRDASYWPESAKAPAVRQQLAKRQGDPLEKGGIVGAFCRTYSVEEAIAKFLPNAYTSCDAPNRYTYTGGSTSAGLVIYDDGRFVYSNHATDPASGKLCNAFDLVRLHLYGDQDSTVEEDTPISQLPSYQAMAELASKDESVKLTLSRERLDKARQEFDLPEEQDDEWMGILERDKKGALYQTIQNTYLILSNDPALKGALAYNEFKSRLVCLQDVPWKQVRDRENGDAWTDTDDSALRRYLETAYGIRGKERIADACAVAAQERRIHPVRQYLKGLHWDGEERLDRLLIAFLSAEDTPYTRAVTRKTFVAAVARIFRPGIKFDYVLVLSGPQGRGKSTLVARMARGWYTDSLAGLGTKEAYEGIQGFWLVELGELAAMRKMEIEVTKNFISKPIDSYRAPYGRRVGDHPRQCIFIGTTNATTFLRDDTGNRRFWPVRLYEREPEKTVWDDLDEATVDQLWAEAAVRYQAGEPLTLGRELSGVAMEQQSEFTEEDPRTGEVQRYLDTLLPENWAERDKEERRDWFAGGCTGGTVQRDRVSAVEIWTECLGNYKDIQRRDANEIRSLLRSIPGWKENVKKQKCGTYGVQRCFERVAKEQKQVAEEQKQVAEVSKE